MLKIFFGTAFVTTLGKLLTILSTVVFARHLGVEEFGVYTYTLSIVSLLLLPAIAGVPNLIIREVSKYYSSNQWAKLKGVIGFSFANVIVISLIAILFFFIIRKPSLEGGDYLNLAIWLVLFKAVVLHNSAVINGLNRTLLSQFIIHFLLPLSLLLVFISAITLGFDITLSSLFKLNVISHFFVMVVVVLVTAKLIYKHVSKVSHYISIKDWYASLMPFTFIAITNTFNAELGSVLLGSMSTHESVSYFKVGMQASGVLIIVTSAMNSILMPRISKLYMSGELDKTQHLLTRAVRISSLFSLFGMIVLFIYGEYAIELLFGEEFVNAYPVLLLLCGSQLVNACSGSVGVTLNMCGFEKETLRIMILSLLLNVVMMLILVPIYGHMGAALSVFVGTIFWNVTLLYFVRKHTGLITHLFRF